MFFNYFINFYFWENYAASFVMICELKIAESVSFTCHCVYTIIVCYNGLLAMQKITNISSDFKQNSIMFD